MMTYKLLDNSLDTLLATYGLEPTVRRLAALCYEKEGEVWANEDKASAWGAAAGALDELQNDISDLGL